MFDLDPESWLLQVMLGTAVMAAAIGACYLLVWLLCRVPDTTDQTVGVLEDEALRRFVPSSPLQRPQPSFVVAAKLVGGMGDGEEVEVHSQLWLAHPPTELRIRAVDETSTPPAVHHLLYRVSPEDSQVFVFAGVVPAPHEMMGD